ncbi:hypothetical protein ACOSQ2_020792 [Xanthoceras sorbifolium]
MSSRQLKLTSIDRENQLKRSQWESQDFLLQMSLRISKSGLSSRSWMFVICVQGKKLGIKASEESFTSKDNDVKMTDAKESSDGSRELSDDEGKNPGPRASEKSSSSTGSSSNGSGESPVATCQDVLYPGIFLLHLKVYEAGSAPIKISSASIFTRCLNLFL